MEAVQGSTQSSSKILSTQAVGGVQKAATATAGGGEFDTALKALLGSDPAKKVSEEDLFSAIVQERIKKTKGEDALKKFQELLTASKDKLKKGDGFVPIEDATKDALRAFRDKGMLDAKEADSIYSQSFAAAQLDENKDALFDDRGGPNDPTIAVAGMEQALLLSRALVEKFDAGSETAPERSLSESSSGKMAGGGAVGSGAGSDVGFLFKPVSESDKKLVVLLPPRLSGMVQGLTLIGPNGEVLESGRYAGNGNGGREHFRFNKPGAQYPDGLTVQAKLTNGEIVRYVIRETSQRTENVSSESGQSTSQGSTSSGSGSTSASSSNANGTGGTSGNGSL